MSWFRGASAEAILPLDSKNVVVYGANGSGKSSFVDAVEYVISNGKIRHLAHEYSGRRQEKAIRNTQAPRDSVSKCRICFDDRSYISAEIKSNGICALESDPVSLKDDVQSWSLENHLLRQDEVARFISLRKGDKYSALLPLLGLNSLEHAAENLKQLREHVVSESKVEFVRNHLARLTERTSRHCVGPTAQYALNGLKTLAEKYAITDCSEEIPTLGGRLVKEIEERIDHLKPTYDRYSAISQMLGEDLTGKAASLATTIESAKGKIDALLDSRIAVLESTSSFGKALIDLDDEVTCPSCGRSLVARDLVNHVARELDTLRDSRALRDTIRTKRRELLESLDRTLLKAKDPALVDWLRLDDQENIAETIRRLDSLIGVRHDTEWKKEDFATLETTAAKLVKSLSKEAKRVPSPVKEFLEDREAVTVSLLVPGILVMQNYAAKVEGLSGIFREGEKLVREEIAKRTNDIIEQISVEVQRLWLKLHPKEAIEQIRLYVPADADAAIDIALKFFGTEQLSPRLTLSEGHRNSLGLCIFLALALKAGLNHPIILDDIVSSLDRDHRGLLVDLITEDLSQRQTILFTHDREWFSELHTRLPSAKWKFLALRPWESPSVGLQWSRSQYAFDDARVLLPDHPEACANRVRSIMETELALIAERLRLSLTFLRGDRNDRRTSVEFLERIIGEAPKRFKKQQLENMLPYEKPIKDWKDARDLLIAWGDRASHTGTLTPTEAERLVKTCEKALDYFRCPSCNDRVWMSDQSSRERLQCTCGELQWRYD